MDYRKSHVELCMEIEHKHSNKFFIKYYLDVEFPDCVYLVRRIPDFGYRLKWQH
jgi:hypothetical protein